MGALSGFLLLCGLGAVMGLLMRSSSTGARRFQEGRITGIVGRKGHGKSLYSVHELLRHLGRPVYCRECKTRHVGSVASNSKLTLRPSLQAHFNYVSCWADLLDQPHGTLVVLDEVHLWAPAQQGEQLPKYVRWLLAQCRKLHLEIIWVSQHEDRCSLGLRRQTDEIGVCRKGLFRSMSVRFFEPEDARKKGCKPAWTFRYRVRKKLIAAYDTYELLAPEGESDVRVTSDMVRAQEAAEGARPRHEAGAGRSLSPRPSPVARGSVPLERTVPTDIALACDGVAPAIAVSATDVELSASVST